MTTPENRRGRGRLKIFLGMAAGVGKTYTMLEAAQKKMRDGVDVVVGNVETHGRPETAKLLEPLKTIAPKKIVYKDKTFTEVDLDAVIKMRPQLVLVDELAHTNVPGSKHLKRWQDVVEILEAGIDVFTTLNIQHIESYKDIVEEIAGVTIRETVPDHIVEMADDIELVDLPPADLLQRLREGKVYTGDLPEVALQHFFQEDRLTALRELSLRFTAEMVDLELHEMGGTAGRSKVWRPRERLLVAVNHKRYMQQLIRSARRLALTLHAPWIALYVDDGESLDEEESAFLSKNLALARELGAEVITTQDGDIAAAIQRVAEQKSITQIIIGKKTEHKLSDLFKPSLADQLSKACSADIHVMKPSAFFPQKKKKAKPPFSWRSLLPYGHILFWMALLTGLNALILPYVGYKVVGSIFLVSILVLSLFFTRGPLFFSAVCYLVIWDLLFVPKVGAFDLSAPEDIGLALLFFLAAFVTGILASRVKKRQDLLLKKERSTEAIYSIVREIGSAPTSKHLVRAIREKLGLILQGRCEIITTQGNGTLYFEDDSLIAVDEKERAVAQWVFEHGKEAGWSTSVLPLVKYLYIPLKGFQSVVGVLAFRPFIEKTLLPEESNLLYTVAQQLAHFLERAFIDERERKSQYLRQVEQVYGKVLQSISDELYTPLQTIQEAAQVYQVSTDREQLEDSLQQIEETSESLLRIAENATAMAKLSGGFVTFELALHDIAQWLQGCCMQIQGLLKQHKLKVSIEPNIPQVAFDISLMSILMRHLLLNAIEYSPEASTIEIEASLYDDTLVLSVLDEGRGIPEDVLDLVFEKFYRVEGTPSSGLGLGLAIVKSIADIHHGSIHVYNRPTGGTKFSLILPL